MASWWDRLPPKDHPIWKILQGAVSILGIIILVNHGSTHEQDLAGVVGAGTGGWLLKSLLGSKES